MTHWSVNERCCGVYHLQAFDALHWFEEVVRKYKDEEDAYNVSGLWFQPACGLSNDARLTYPLCCCTATPFISSNKRSARHGRRSRRRDSRRRRRRSSSTTKKKCTRCSSRPSASSSTGASSTCLTGHSTARASSSRTKMRHHDLSETRRNVEVKHRTRGTRTKHTNTPKDSYAAAARPSIATTHAHINFIQISIVRTVARCSPRITAITSRLPPWDLFVRFRCFAASMSRSLELLN